MFCPSCKKGLAEAASRCGTCGFEFADELQQKLRFYFILKTELDDLVSTGKLMDRRIQSLSGRLSEYRDEIRVEIERLAQERNKEREEVATAYTS